jgi:hypothetical protein
MAGGLGSFLLFVPLNNATQPPIVTSGMGFGGGSRYKTPATTASRGLTVAPQLKPMKKFRRMR